MEELDNNIKQLEESYKGRNDRLSYYKGMLASNDQRGTGGAKAGSAAGGRASQMDAAAATQKAAPIGKDKSQRTISTTGLEEPSIQMNRTGRPQAPRSAFDLHLLQLGATRDQIRNINDMINQLVEKTDVKGESSTFDTADKIALLKKVEIKFHLLAEDRKVFSFFDPDRLRSREQEIKQETKTR